MEEVQDGLKIYCLRNMLKQRCKENEDMYLHLINVSGLIAESLMVAHFSDLNLLSSKYQNVKGYDDGFFHILHAPNHRSIKGSDHIISAVEELNNEGYKIKLHLIEKVSNAESISKVDLVIDQLIIGWYAMFAIESMALSKPTICYLRDDLLNYINLVG